MSRVIYAVAALFALAAVASWVAFSWTQLEGWQGTAITFTFAAPITGFVGALVNMGEDF